MRIKVILLALLLPCIAYAQYFPRAGQISVSTNSFNGGLQGSNATNVQFALNFIDVRLGDIFTWMSTNAARPETDPVFVSWLGTNTYLKSFTELDPIFMSWLGTNGYVKAESDPVFNVWAGTNNYHRGSIIYGSPSGSGTLTVNGGVLSFRQADLSDYATIGQLVVAQNTANTASNLAATANGIAVTGSNLAATANNTANTASNLAATANTTAGTATNLANAAQSTANTASNLAATASSTAVIASNLAATANTTAGVEIGRAHV